MIEEIESLRASEVAVPTEKLKEMVVVVVLGMSMSMSVSVGINRSK